MTRKQEHPRWSGCQAAPAAWIAAAALALAMGATPLRAQTPSRFSPRLAADSDAASGPALAIYAGSGRLYDGQVGTAFGIQLELGRLGPARGLLGIVAGKEVGSVEAGLLVRPEREAATSPYMALTVFTHGLEDDASGIALHVGAEVRHIRELGLRLEGRAYLADQAALLALIGVAFR